MSFPTARDIYISRAKKEAKKPQIKPHTYLFEAPPGANARDIYILRAKHEAKHMINHSRTSAKPAAVLGRVVAPPPPAPERRPKRTRPKPTPPPPPAPSPPRPAPWTQPTPYQDAIEDRFRQCEKNHDKCKKELKEADKLKQQVIDKDNQEKERLKEELKRTMFRFQRAAFESQKNCNNAKLTLQRQIKELKKKIKDIDISAPPEIKQKRKRMLSTLNNELKATQAKLEKCNTEGAKCQIDLSTCKEKVTNKLKRFKDKLEELKEKLEALKEKEAATSRRLKDCEETKTTLRDANKELKQKLDGVKEKLKTCTTQTNEWWKTQQGRKKVAANAKEEEAAPNRPRRSADKEIKALMKDYNVIPSKKVQRIEMMDLIGKLRDADELNFTVPSKTTLKKARKILTDYIYQKNSQG